MQQTQERMRARYLPNLPRISITLRFVTAFVVVCLASAMGQINTKFETGCGALPFEDIAIEHKDVDDVCGIEGVHAPTDEGNKKQNLLKNNFCRKGKPVVISTTDLLTMQKKIDALDDFRYGSGSSVPEDRSPLEDVISVGGKKVGEGTLITLVGYMIDPHYSDVKKGEGVNCKQKGKVKNDIHYSISRSWHDIDNLDKTQKQLQLCNLVSGEINPHFRPESWEVDNLSDLDRIPVRLTGQLFFDASHKPCRPGKPLNPARASVFELHPTYAIDVCKSKTKAKCRANVNSDWITMDAWVAEQEKLRESEKEE